MPALGFSGERRNMSVGSGLRRAVVRMHWFVHYFVMLFPLASCVVSVVESNTKYSIHWNASNNIFSPSNNLHVININYQDTIDIICPSFDEDTPESELKYYKIYRVSQNEYNDCTIYNPTNINTRLVATCKYPLREITWTLWITGYQSVPNGLEFQKGGTYYFISTSKGTLATIDNQLEGGACSEDNMKFILNICCAITGPVSTSVTDCITCSTRTVNPNTPTTASTRRPSTKAPTPSTRPTRPPDTTPKPSTRSPNEIPTAVDENKEKYRPKVTDNTEINADGLNRWPKNMGLINASAQTIYPSSIVLLLLTISAVTLS